MSTRVQIVQIVQTVQDDGQLAIRLDVSEISYDLNDLNDWNGLKGNQIG